MSCDVISLSAYLDGELSSADRSRVEEHLQRCAECRRELARLDKTRTVLAVWASEQPDFHQRLMRRAEEDHAGAPRRDGPPRLLRLGWVGAAILLAGVAGLVWWYAVPASDPLTIAQPTERRESPGGDSTPRSIDEAPLTAEADGRAVGGDTALAAVRDEDWVATTLPLALLGTIAGERPLAVIARQPDGAQSVYAVGDAVLPGIRLVEIAKAYVVLNNNGTMEELHLADMSPFASLPPPDGVWSMTATIGTATEGSGRVLQKSALVLMQTSGADLMICLAEKDSDAVLASGTLYGNHAVFDPESIYMNRATIASDNAEPAVRATGSHDTIIRPYLQRVEQEFLASVSSPPERVIFDGDFNNDRSEFHAAWTVHISGAPHTIAVFQFTRLREQDLADMTLAAAREQEVRTMLKTLRRYAKDHEGRFPERLPLLIPEYGPEALFADTPTRKIHYISGVRLPMWTGGPRPDFQPNLPEPERLMAWEKTLEQQFGKESLLRTRVLEVRYTDPDATYVAYSLGRVNEQTETTGAGADDWRSSPTRLASLRRDCQNNLKQLGIVVKMYENESQGGYTPPGWLSVYPEYMTDPSILTSPKDPEGTDSYVYLFPATNIEGLIRQTMPDFDKEAAQDPTFSHMLLARVMSEIPLVINRSDFPGERAGRNVLFADGHVEYFVGDNWRTKLDPWLRLSGVRVP